MLESLLEDKAGKPRLAALDLILRAKKIYDSYTEVSKKRTVVDKLSGGRGQVKAQAQGPAAAAGPGAARSDGSASSEGADAGAKRGGEGKGVASKLRTVGDLLEPGWTVKNDNLLSFVAEMLECAESSEVELSDEKLAELEARCDAFLKDGVTTFSGQSLVGMASSSRQVAAERYAALLDHVRAAGYDVQFIEGKLAEMGSIKGSIIRTALADAANPTAEEFVTLLHEAAGHGVFADESPEMQRVLIDAVAQMSNDTLGLGKDFNPRLDPRLKGAAREGVRQEERLVESMARHLEQSGFDPAASKGWAQALWRKVKDLYLRGLMLLQQAFMGREASGSTALKYFENRMRALASGDAAYSFTSWLGGPKLNRAAQAERISHADGAGTLASRFDLETEEMVYAEAEAEPDTVEGMEWNAAVRTAIGTTRTAAPSRNQCQLPPRAMPTTPPASPARRRTATGAMAERDLSTGVLTNRARQIRGEMRLESRCQGEGSLKD